MEPSLEGLAMTWTPDEARQIGRLETSLKAISTALVEVKPRVTELETFANRVKGVLAVIMFGGSILAIVLMSGCTTTKTACRIKTPTTEYTGIVRTTVIGKGDSDISAMGNRCGDFTATSKDGGISDNGVRVIENAVAAGVKAAIPGLP